MTDNTLRITDARELQNLTLRELLKQGYLLTQERDKHSLGTELDELIQEYSKQLKITLRLMGVSDLLVEQQRLAGLLQCLPSNQRIQFDLHEITEFITRFHRKMAELEHTNIQSIITEKHALEQEQTKVKNAVKNNLSCQHNLCYNLHEDDSLEESLRLSFDPKHDRAEADLSRINQDLDSYRGVIHYRIAQMPLAETLAVINAPRTHDLVQERIKRLYTTTMDQIGLNKFEHIGSWEEQVAAREINWSFPSLFELEADIKFWREWAVLQPEGQIYRAHLDPTSANAHATRLEAIATARRAMLQEDCTLVLATGLHQRLGETSLFRTLDPELVKMVANIAFPQPLVPPPDAPPEV